MVMFGILIDWCLLWCYTLTQPVQYICMFTGQCLSLSVLAQWVDWHKTCGLPVQYKSLRACFFCLDFGLFLSVTE